MIAVVLVALAFPAGNEVQRLWDLSIENRRRADWMACEVEIMRRYPAKAVAQSERNLSDARTLAERAERLRTSGAVQEAKKWRDLAAIMRHQSAENLANAELARRCEDYWSRLKLRYDRAAIYPFLPLPPDPPLPK